MVYMSELHKSFKFARKEVVWITFRIFDFIEQNGPNRKKYAMKKGRLNLPFNVLLYDQRPCPKWFQYVHHLMNSRQSFLLF